MNTRTRTITATTILAVIFAILGVGIVSAAPLAGHSPYQALSPEGDTMRSLDLGQSDWYAFQYNGNDESLIRVQLWGNNAEFGVWTRNQIEDWDQGIDVDPIGRSAEEEFVDGDLSWAGSFNTTDTYFVRVEQTGTTAANYRLSVSGADVSVPSETTHELEMTIFVAPVTAVPVLAQTTHGSGPEDALAIDGGWRSLGAGETDWYSFRSDGDEATQFTLELNVDPMDGATFSIWTEGQILDWAQGLDVDPIGRGTSNDLAEDGLTWSGNFNSTGTLYVTVEYSGAGTTNYSIALQ